MEGRVQSLWRYPVKSMLGESLDEIVLDEDGVVGDRRFAVFDRVSNRPLSAKREPRLLGAAARTVDGRVEVILPDRAVVRPDDADVASALSQWLGKAVEMRLPVPGIRTTVEVARDVGTIPEIGVFELPAGSLVDDSPIHLLSTATLRRATAHHPAGRWDIRRFRPNVMLDLPGGVATEEDWVGRTISVGQARLRVDKLCGRCVMTTKAQGDLPSDVGILRSLLRHRGGNLGVYAGVVAPGPVRVGDVVAIDDA